MAASEATCAPLCAPRQGPPESLGVPPAARFNAGFRRRTGAVVPREVWPVGPLPVVGVNQTGDRKEGTAQPSAVAVRGSIGREPPRERGPQDRGRMAWMQGTGTTRLRGNWSPWEEAGRGVLEGLPAAHGSEASCSCKEAGRQQDKGTTPAEDCSVRNRVGFQPAGTEGTGRCQRGHWTVAVTFLKLDRPQRESALRWRSCTLVRQPKENDQGGPEWDRGVGM